MVEMKNFTTSFETKDEINGSFVINHYSDIPLPIKFTLKQDKVHFIIGTFYKDLQFPYKKWLEEEGEEYRDFLQNYFKKILDLNRQLSFEGNIIEEFEEKFDGNIIKIHCKYNSFPHEVKFTYVESENTAIIEFDIPTPINSKGETLSFAIIPPIQPILKPETLKRMWEPFRDKAKNRLKLIHLFK